MSIDMDDFTKIIESHLKDQPYKICCTCGTKLECTATVDSDYDLNIEVEPCRDCMEQAQ